ncbi:ComEC/Rec2 family competence protein [Patescibacteria group bacterium]
MNRLLGIRYTAIFYFIFILLVVYRVGNHCNYNIRICKEKGSQNSSVLINEHGFLMKLRTSLVETARANFPSPHAELLLGMTIGIDKLYELPDFKEMLRNTGTIHVVVVSGYNITLIFNYLVKFVGSKYKVGNLAVCLLGTLIYAIFSGFEPPVVRAWLMGSLASLGAYYGRNINLFGLLFFIVMLMLLFDPQYLFSLSFQLSTLATLSLVIFSEMISSFLTATLKNKSVFVEDLSSTISAQILVWPLLSLTFGKISLVSIVVNTLILWTVPLITSIGLLYLVVSSIFTLFGTIFSVVLFIPLDIFVVIVEFFSKWRYASVDIQISTIVFVLYYLLLFLSLELLIKRE